MSFAINQLSTSNQVTKASTFCTRKKNSALERCPNQDTFVKSNNVSFGSKVTAIGSLLKNYNDGGIDRIGKSIYAQNTLAEIQRIAETIGVKKAIKILGHGLESIAIEVPSYSKGSEVLKISKVALPDFILDISNQKTTTSHAKLVNDELAKYIVAPRKYQVHKLDNGHVWYSYFQDIAPNSTTKDGKKVKLLTNDMCNKFAKQVKDETAYVINENMAKQYGIITYPNGKQEIRAVDLGIFEPKLGHESDEWFDMKEILKEAASNKKMRLKTGFDARVYKPQV